MFLLEDALTGLDRGQNWYPLDTCKGGWKERLNCCGFWELSILDSSDRWNQTGRKKRCLEGLEKEEEPKHSP